MIAKPFWFRFDTNVLYAQAYGCWLFIHVGTWALFLGGLCPFGLRIELTKHRRQFKFVKHDRRRIVSGD